MSLFIGVDPGTNTGMAALRVAPTRVALLDTTTVNHHDRWAADQLADWAAHWPFDHEQLVVVMESFTAREGVKGKNLDAIRQIEVVRYWAARVCPYPVQLILREPVQGKLMVTNDVLRNLELYQRGKVRRHINDATRHVVSYLAEKGHLDVCTRGWPNKENA